MKIAGNLQELNFNESCWQNQTVAHQIVNINNDFCLKNGFIVDCFVEIFPGTADLIVYFRKTAWLYV